MKTGIRPNTRGFTLIELLVVVAVIALLIGVLLPALGKARRSAQQSQGAQLQRQLLLGLQSYANSNDYDIPGLNTSGAKYDTLNATAIDNIDKNADAPVQAWDWISPSIDEQNLPVNRLHRLHYMFTQFRDPSMNETAQVIDAPEGATEIADVITERGDFTGPSFLMPFAWQIAGQTFTDNNGNNTQWGQIAGDTSLFELPKSWRPNTSKIGNEARKIAVSDGFAALNSSNGSAVLDASLFKEPTIPLTANDPLALGAFVSPTPLIEQNAIFGDPQGDSIAVRRHDLCYRHSGRMNVGYFDGHVEAIDRSASYDPRLWFPQGTIMGSSGQIQQAALNIIQAGEKIN